MCTVMKGSIYKRMKDYIMAQQEGCLDKHLLRD